MSASSYTVHRYTAPPTYRVALAERPELREQVRAAVDNERPILWRHCTFWKAIIPSLINV